MTTKTATTPHVALSTEDKALADKMKARADEKKAKSPLCPPLMAIF